MTRSHTCRHCLAFGLLASLLIHAATWQLAWRITPQPPPQPAMTVIDLDLAVFADAPGGASAAGTAEPVLIEPAPSDAARTPEQPAVAPPAPSDPTPAVAAEPPTPPARQPAPVASVQPPPVQAIKPPPPAQPKRRQEPKRTKPKPVQATPIAKPKPEPKPKPEARSAVKPAPEPRQQPPESARTRTSPLQAATPASTPAPHKPTAPAAASSGTGTRPTSADGSTAGAGARPAAGATSAAARAAAERAYLAELQRAISRHQRFPEEARQRRKTGVATVAFVVTADGRITQARIAKSSGDADLDQAAVAALNRLGRFKPIPAASGRASWPMRVPIRFDFR